MMRRALALLALLVLAGCSGKDEELRPYAVVRRADVWQAVVKDQDRGRLARLSEAWDQARADVAEAGAAAVADNAIGPHDVVVGTAASGSTPYTTAAIQAARARGALTIGLANSPGGTLLAAAEHPILVETGAEAIAGSTRMKAGTAQKIVLNLLSSQIMIQLGRVHLGLMVDMQAKNEKLRLRALRMLRHLTGEADQARLQSALAAADNKVKTAVLIVHGLDRPAAEASLLRNGNRLRLALKEIGK